MDLPPLEQPNHYYVSLFSEVTGYLFALTDLAASNGLPRTKEQDRERRAFYLKTSQQFLDGWPSWRDMRKYWIALLEDRLKVLKEAVAADGKTQT